MVSEKIDSSKQGKNKITQTPKKEENLEFSKKPEEFTKEQVLKMHLLELADHIRMKQKLRELVPEWFIPVFTEKAKDFIKENFDDLAKMAEGEETDDLKEKVDRIRPLILSHPIANDMLVYLANNGLGEEGIKRLSDKERELDQTGAGGAADKAEMEAAENNAKKWLSIVELFFGKKEADSLENFYNFYRTVNRYIELDSKPYYTTFTLSKLLLEFLIRKKELREALEKRIEDSEEVIKELETRSKEIADFAKAGISLDVLKIEKLLFPKEGEEKSSAELIEELSNGLQKYLKLRVFLEVYSDIQTAETIFPKEFRMVIYSFYNNLVRAYNNAQDSQKFAELIEKGEDPDLNSALSSFEALLDLGGHRKTVHLIKEGYIIAEKEVSQILEGLMSYITSKSQKNILATRKLQSDLAIAKKDLFSTKTEIGQLVRLLSEGEISEEEMFDLGLEVEAAEEPIEEPRKAIKLTGKQIEELEQRLKKAREKEQKLKKQIENYQRKIRGLTMRYKQSSILKAIDRVKLVMFTYIQDELSKMEVSFWEDSKKLLKKLTDVLLMPARADRS